MTRLFPKSQPLKQLPLLPRSLPLSRMGSPRTAPGEEYGLCIWGWLALLGVFAKFLSHNCHLQFLPLIFLPSPPPSPTHVQPAYNLSFLALTLQASFNSGFDNRHPTHITNLMVHISSAFSWHLATLSDVFFPLQRSTLSLYILVASILVAPFHI